jgi:hypothetical protein
MKHFVSIIFDKKPINEEMDVVVSTAANSSNIGLLENDFEYEIYESDDSKFVITIPTVKSLNENEADTYAQKLANKVFDAGYKNFDIELSVNEKISK